MKKFEFARLPLVNKRFLLYNRKRYIRRICHARYGMCLAEEYGDIPE